MLYDSPILQMVMVGLGALCLAFIAFSLVASVRIESSISKRMRDFTDAKEQSVFDRYGAGLTQRLHLPQTPSLESALKWAQIGGHYEGWTVGGLLLRSLVFALVGILYVQFTRSAPVFYLGVLAAASWPVVRVTSKADEVKREISRLLPEIATVIAAEMDAGGTPDQALARASEIPGGCGYIISQAVRKTRESNRPMFSRGTVRGVLVDELSVWEMPSLLRFGNQIDRVAGKGVEGPRIMAEISRGFAREYKSAVSQAAAALDNKLMFPMMIFFFAPFMIGLMAPLIVSLMGAL